VRNSRQLVAKSVTGLVTCVWRRRLLVARRCAASRWLGLGLWVGLNTGCLGRASLGPRDVELGQPGDSETSRDSSVVIEANAPFTRTLSVLVALRATSATAYALAFSLSDCEANQAWIPMQAQITVTLPFANAENSVFAKFRGAAGAATACVSDSIVHDGLEPLAPDILSVVRPENGDLSQTPAVSYGQRSRPERRGWF